MVNTSKTSKYLKIEHTRICGIYFLVREQSIVYIGKSINVIKRVAEHGTRIKYDYFRIIPCSVDELDFYERRWIIKFKPIENGKFVVKWIGTKGNRKQIPSEVFRPSLYLPKRGKHPINKDLPTHKDCQECKEKKPITEFYIYTRKSRKGYVYKWANTYCKPCYGQRHKIYQLHTFIRQKREA